MFLIKTQDTIFIVSAISYGHYIDATVCNIAFLTPINIETY